MQVLDNSALSISQPTSGNHEQQVENPGLEEPRQATLTLLEAEGFEQEQVGEMHI
jgi:hypothetical protein